MGFAIRPPTPQLSTLTVETVVLRKRDATFALGTFASAMKPDSHIALT